MELSGGERHSCEVDRGEKRRCEMMDDDCSHTNRMQTSTARPPGLNPHRSGGKWKASGASARETVAAARNDAGLHAPIVELYGVAPTRE